MNTEEKIAWLSWIDYVPYVFLAGMFLFCLISSVAFWQEKGKQEKRTHKIVEILENLERLEIYDRNQSIL